MQSTDKNNEEIFSSKEESSHIIKSESNGSFHTPSQNIDDDDEEEEELQVVEEVSQRPQATKVLKEGFLKKEGKTVRSWKRRYFKLFADRIEYYIDDKGPMIGFLELSKRVIVNEVSRKGHLHTFSISLPRRTFIFSAETHVDMEDWIQSIQAAVNEIPRDGEEEVLLSLRAKVKNTDNNVPRFIKRLQRKIPKKPVPITCLFLGDGKAETKLLIRYTNDSIFDNVVYMKKSYEEPKMQIFGSSLKDLIDYEKPILPKQYKPMIPIIVQDLCNEINKRDLKKGIFRVPGSDKFMKDFVNDINSGISKNLGEIGTDDIASLLKLYFRMLPDPLFTYDAYDLFITAGSIENECERKNKLAEIVKTLPQENQVTMKYLLQFLKSISEKPELKMNIGNLSIAWYPSLIRHRGQLSQIESLAHMRYLILVLQTMLSNIDEIFQDQPKSIKGKLVFENGKKKIITFEGKQVTLSLYDITKPEQIKGLNPNVIVLCFSVTQPESYRNLEKWKNVINSMDPRTPIVLCGTGIHLRRDGVRGVTEEQIIDLSNEIPFTTYTECSEETRAGINKTFREIVLLAMRNKSMLQKKNIQPPLKDATELQSN